MKKIGLTGGIGCGKSYVARILNDYGIEVYDCDSAAKRLMTTDTNLQQRLSKAVGTEVFPDGKLCKPILASFLLKSEENAKLIDSIVHPAVAEDFNKSGLQWLESAILFECGFNKYVDLTVCVTAPLEVRIQRVMQRDNITRDQVIDWMNRQMSQEDKVKLADFTITNDDDSNVAATANDLVDHSNNLRKQLEALIHEVATIAPHSYKAATAIGKVATSIGKTTSRTISKRKQ